MKKIIILICFLSISGNIFGQSAIQLYNDAKEAIEENKYEVVIEKLSLAKNILNQSNPKIEALLAQAYFRNGDIIEAKVAYEKLIKLTPGRVRNSSSFEPFVDLGRQIDDALEEEQKEFEEEQEEKQERRMREAEKIAERTEKQHIAKVERKKREGKNADYFYRKAKENGSKEAYREFSESFPQSKEADYAKKRIADIEAEEFRIANEPNVWRDAVDKHTISAFENYLDIYPDGNHLTEAREYVYQIEARNLYNKAVSTNQLKYYEEYYNNWKRGNDFGRVRDKLERSYLFLANQSMKSKNWESADTYFDNYEIVTKGQPLPRQVQKDIKKTNRMLRQHSFNMVSLTADENSYFGVMIGRYSKDRISSYLRFRIRSNVFFGSFDIYPDDKAKDFPSFNQGENGIVQETGNAQTLGSVQEIRYTRTGLIKKSNFFLTYGLTQKLFYPLWISAGVGIGYIEEYYQVQLDHHILELGYQMHWEDAVAMDYVKDSEVGPIGITAEAGLNLVLKPFIFQGGINYSYDEWKPYVGFGLKL